MSRTPAAALAIVFLATSLSAAGFRTIKCPRVVGYATWQKRLTCVDAKGRPSEPIIDSAFPGANRLLYSNDEAHQDVFPEQVDVAIYEEVVECHYAVDPSYQADYRAPNYSTAGTCGDKCPQATSQKIYWQRTLKSDTDTFTLMGSTDRRARPSLSRNFLTCQYADSGGWVSSNPVYAIRVPDASATCTKKGKGEVRCQVTP